MCGIFGFFNKDIRLDSKIWKKNESISKLSSQRGKEAAGMIGFNLNGIGAIVKSDLDGSKILKTHE